MTLHIAPRQTRGNKLGRPHLIDLTGKRFGRWKVLAIHPERDIHGHSLWLCRCDCGTERIVRGDVLRLGGSKSCGCHKREYQRRRLTKHGMSKTRAYKRWQCMLQRCFNARNPSYSWYGGRGITVCEYYRDFVDWYADLGDPPDGMSQDRIRSDENYEPGNCRWAPPSVQSTNQRRLPKTKTKHPRVSRHHDAADEFIAPPFDPLEDLPFKGADAIMNKQSSKHRSKT